MKISSAQIGFNTQHEKSVAESVQQQRLQSHQERTLALNENNRAGSQTDLEYQAHLLSQKSVEVSAQSRIRSGEEEILIQQTQNTRSLVETVLQQQLSIEDLQPLNTGRIINIPNVIDLSNSQLYVDVEQINIQGEVELQQQQQLQLQRVEQIEVELSLMQQVEETRVEVQEQRTYQEQEYLKVGSQGVVTTEDGREISFMLELEMERNFKLEENLALEKNTRTLIDPLVINLNGGAAGLTSSSFSFDLNADGEQEEISFVTQGSGFLALDLNEDGEINDGSELFGTQGQSGFSHLARYDDDNNLWIDENDEIFEKLKVWTRDDQGNDQLISLKDAGVGAIYLGSTSSNFDLTDDENNLLGQVKRSGVFLTEEGGVASIQELDIAVREAEEPSHLVNRASEKAQALAGEETETRNFNQLQFEQSLDFSQAPESSRLNFEREVEKTQQQESSYSKTVLTSADEDKQVFIAEMRQQHASTLQSLHEKTSLQLVDEQDKYSHLKSIIEALKQQRDRDNN